MTNQTTSFVNAYALRLKDEGTFTCEVVDVAPCEVRIQSYSLNINVKGKYVYKLVVVWDPNHFGW